MVAVAHETEVQRAALEYQERGFRVIPIDPYAGDNKKAGMVWRTTKYKKPVREFVEFFRPPVSALSIVLGSESKNLVVRDFDDADAYHAWKRDNGDLAASQPTVQTGRGFHVYGVAEGVRSRPVEHGEIRSNGNYVVAPPSLHASGSRYRWINPLPPVNASELPPFPESLLVPECRPSLPGQKTLESSPSLPHTGDKNVLCSIFTSADIENAVISCAIRDLGTRDKMRFELARKLRAYYPENVCPSVLQLPFDNWYARSSHKMRTPDYRREWVDFLRVWKLVKWPYGASLREAMRNATTELEPGAKPVVRLMALCKQLQAQWGDKPFFLASRDAGGFMDRVHSVAWTYMKELVRAGILVVHTKPVLGEKGRAGYYFYRGV